jgi:hypothetical protein
MLNVALFSLFSRTLLQIEARRPAIPDECVCGVPLPTSQLRESLSNWVTTTSFNALSVSLFVNH